MYGNVDSSLFVELPLNIRATHIHYSKKTVIDGTRVFVFVSCLIYGLNAYYFYYRYSALGPVWAETRAQSDDWYGSGTPHPGQILRGSGLNAYIYIYSHREVTHTHICYSSIKMHLMEVSSEVVRRMNLHQSRNVGNFVSFWGEASRCDV
jgi:hypothetical protein